MHASSNKPLVLILIVLALALASCTPTGPAPAPTLDQQVVESTVQAAQTNAVSTAMAELTANAPVATETPLPTETVPPTEEPTVAAPTLALATSTAVPVLPTNTYIPFTALPTITSTPSRYQCEITKLNPPWNAVLEPGTDFDLNVTMENSGTRDWPDNSFDFRYVSGTEFQVSVDALDLSEEVETGDSTTFVVDMEAPDDDGIYKATWTLSGDGFTACTVVIQIEVED